MTITANHTSLWKFVNFDWKLPIRGIALLGDMDLTKKGIRVVKDVMKIIKICKKMPDEYDREAVIEWAEQYDKIFTAK